jgi:hypothetical protein
VIKLAGASLVHAMENGKSRYPCEAVIAGDGAMRVRL